MQHSQGNVLTKNCPRCKTFRNLWKASFSSKQLCLSKEQTLYFVINSLGLREEGKKGETHFLSPSLNGSLKPRHAAQHYLQQHDKVMSLLSNSEYTSINIYSSNAASSAV